MKSILNFDVVVDTPSQAVDMKAGLETLQGVSDATRFIAETVLTEHVPMRLSHKSSVRTTLKQTFNGSYGQIYSLDIADSLNKKINAIGKTVLTELISYFLNEALYTEPQHLSDKAQKIFDNLGDSSEQLVEQLRKSALENIHEISTKFNHEVKVRVRQSRDNQTVLAKFNNETAQVLLAEELDEEADLTVSITRLNINTGNGRLLIDGETDTVAFGFAHEYKDIRLSAKKKFSENLDHNNGLQPQNWLHLKITATPIKLKSGKVVKYIVRRFTS
jgi:ElaB/YqjD/DUF883 family membrane-anchored ribosome-binding protein